MGKPNFSDESKRDAVAQITACGYLAVVIDLNSRRVVGWSMHRRQTTDVVLQALHMAVWRRRPKNRVLIHSGQGSQFTRMDGGAFIRAHTLEHSMSRRGNCHDNAAIDSFLSSFKRGRIRRRNYNTREEARQDVSDYVEMLCNPVCKQVGNGRPTPAEFERHGILKAEGVQKSRGYSELHPPARSRANQGWHCPQRKPEPGISRDHAPISCPFSIAQTLISPRTLRQNPFA